MLSVQAPLETTLLPHTDEYAFMGALIIQEVVRELLGKGLSGAKVLLLAGSRWARRVRARACRAGREGRARRDPAWAGSGRVPLQGAV